MPSITEVRAGHWLIQVSDRFDPQTGKRRRISRRVRGTRRDAEHELARLLGHREQSLTAAGGTIKELIDQWLESAESNLEQKTVHRYRELARLHINPHLGGIPVRQLNVQMVEAWMRTLADPDGPSLARSTIGQARAVLRRALTEAGRWDMVGRNVAKLAQVPGRKETKRKIRVPSPETVSKAIANATPDFADAIAIAATLGLRRGELAGLQWRDLDQPKKLLRIERCIVTFGADSVVKSPKTHQVREIPVPASLVRRLVARRVRVAERALAVGVALKEDSWMLSPRADPNELAKPSWLTQSWRQLGLGWRLHDLRHFAGTQMMLSGVPVTTVASILGHSSTQMTLDVYGHSDDESERAAVEGLGSLIGL